MIMEQSRNPFYYRSSFILLMTLMTHENLWSQSLLLQVFIHTWGNILLYQCNSRNPFYYRSSFIQSKASFNPSCQNSRNPFYYRSSFIRFQIRFSTACRTVAIPSITGLHSYLIQSKKTLALAWSQSLLLQVFIHTLRCSIVDVLFVLVAIPSITGLHSYLDSTKVKQLQNESQSLLLQVFIHTSLCVSLH